MWGNEIASYIFKWCVFIGICLILIGAGLHKGCECACKEISKYKIEIKEGASK